MAKDKNKFHPKPPERVALGNIYDRVFKENAKAMLPFFLKEEPIKIQQVKDKFPLSLERELDMLFKIEYQSGETSLLHLEFQVSSHPKMAYRMLAYYALARHFHELPIRQLVVYIGTGRHNMVNIVHDHELNYSYEIVALNQLDPELFLSAQVPEIIILALLSKYDKEQSERILRLTFNRLLQHSQGLPLEKISKHLGILARLRNFDNELVKTITDMPLYINPEEDMLYQKGMQVGELKGLDKGIEVFKECIRLYRAGLPIATISSQLSIDITTLEIWIKDAQELGLA
jgi:predicted transposase/invertase (TIGR01784 family)